MKGESLYLHLQTIYYVLMSCDIELKPMIK